MTRHAIASAVVFLAGAGAGCGSAGARIPVDVPAARAPLASDEVAREVGLLLSSDPRASREAEAVLLSLDMDGRKALAEHARKIPTEKDLRWRNVLDENGLLADLPVEERIDLLIWKVSRSEPVLVLKAQNGLLDIARKDPAPLLARLKRPAPGRDVIAVTLANAGLRPAVPALLDLYRTAPRPDERRAAAAALGRLAGENLQPRAEGSPVERERDAQLVESWYRRLEASNDAKR